MTELKRIPLMPNDSRLSAAGAGRISFGQALPACAAVVNRMNLVRGIRARFMTHLRIHSYRGWQNSGLPKLQKGNAKRCVFLTSGFYPDKRPLSILALSGSL
ncbi:MULTISPECIES: hypothetical protein [Pantoea]|uniref:hypothetical protein n=1 Tax=Pantoea TaxID=53335 RepID=UPI0011B075EA|nr:MULTISPECIES: hypothetical protein [Pantoea]MDI3416145.1 hypothetical protein [Pantoea sp. V106_11]